MNREFPIVHMGDGESVLAHGLELKRFRIPPGSGPGRHTHSFHQVTVLLSSPGRTRWCCGDTYVRSGRPTVGEVFICPAFTATLGSWERAFEGLSLRLSPTFLGRVAECLDGQDVVAIQPLAMKRDPFVQHVVHSLFGEVGRNRAGKGLFATTLCTALAVHLLREYAGKKWQPGPYHAGLAAERLQRVRRFIEDHLDGDLSLDRLAAVAYLSPYHFARRFKVSTGMTPHQYVVSRRVERAQALLLAGEDGIAHVATRVGFSSQSHLTFHMRRVLGVSPGELLRRSRRSTERLLSAERCWQQ